MKSMKIPTPDGKKIAAVIHYPKIETGKLAILCPGYLDSKDYDHLVQLAKTLATRGYAVVRFDPIGTWESDGEMNNYTAANYLACIQSVKDYMLRSGKYDFILLGGHSRGGRMSIIYAASDKDISYVVAIMPSASSFIRAGEEEIGDEPQRHRRDIPGEPGKYREYVVPAELVLDSSKYSSVSAVPNVHVPILLIAGEKDMLIPLDEIKSIYNVANEPKKLIVIPGIGHDYRKNPSEIKIVNDTILEVLSRVKV